MNERQASVAARIADMSRLPIADIWALWDRYFSSRPMNPNRAFLESRIAYKLQEEAFGGLAPETKQRLEAIGAKHSKIKLRAKPREFDFAPFEAMRGQLVELGRACIHRDHRNFAVLNLLWKGIAAYAQAHGARYLVGCSSLTSQDAREGAAAYRQLSRHLAPPAWRTRPTPAFDCTQDPGDTPPPRIPRLLSAYLALGAGICGPPALDREFRTIDFLTWLDVQTPSMLAMQQRGRFKV